MSITINNHYVPKGYLRSFAQIDGQIYRYSLLVSKDSVAPWKRSHISSTGYHRHLYTRVIKGEAKDEIEVWLNREFETPASPALTRAICDQRLSKDDYRVLSRFVAAQHVRTPAFFLKNRKLWENSAVSDMESNQRSILRRLESANRTDTPLEPKEYQQSRYLPLRVRELPNEDPAMCSFRSEMVIGRAHWIFAMKHLLDKTLDRLADHRWTILKAPRDISWFTSDDPVIQLNYHQNHKYDFGGGWGSEGTEILLPISPSHLLYTQIGRKPPQRGTILPHSVALEIRRIIAQHAHRIIYSHLPDRDIERLRPRVVNPTAVRHERSEWEKFHREQSHAEADFFAE